MRQIVRRVSGGVGVATVLFALLAATGACSRHPAVKTVVASPNGGFRVPMTVHPGDSLWSLARRYGDPDVYMLDRVDAIAKANGIGATAPLFPGQRLVVPVSNPVELEHLQHNLALK